MFRVRGVSHEEKLENLRFILSNKEDISDNRISVGTLPTNRDVLLSLRYNPPPNLDTLQPPPHPFEILNNCIVAVAWIVNKKKTWFLGCVTKNSKDEPNIAFIDHLERAVPGSNVFWRYPRVTDQCPADLKQILGIKPLYEWEISARIQKLKLKNHEIIRNNLKGFDLD